MATTNKAEMAFSEFSREFMTTADVAAVLNLTRSAIYKRIERKSIPNAKIGNRVVFLRGHLKAWASRYRERPLGRL